MYWKKKREYNEQNTKRLCLIILHLNILAVQFTDRCLCLQSLRAFYGTYQFNMFVQITFQCKQFSTSIATIPFNTWKRTEVGKKNLFFFSKLTTIIVNLKISHCSFLFIFFIHQLSEIIKINNAKRYKCFFSKNSFIAYNLFKFPMKRRI